MLQKVLYLVGRECGGERLIVQKLFAQKWQEELGQYVPIQYPHPFHKGAVEPKRLLARLGFFVGWYIFGLLCPPAEPPQHSPHSQRPGNRWRPPARCTDPET